MNHEQESIKKKTILVAEDEPVLAHSLALKLGDEGFTVTTVGHGRVVLDGWGALIQPQGQKYSPPIFVASNLGRVTYVAKAKSLGAASLVVKSETTPADIVKKISKYQQP